MVKSAPKTSEPLPGLQTGERFTSDPNCGNGGWATMYICCTTSIE